MTARPGRMPEEILRAAGVAFAVREDAEVAAAGAADAVRTGEPAGGAVRTLAIETGGELILAMLRAGDALHPGKLAKALGVGRSTLNAVSAAALELELGFEVGAVSLLTDFPAARLIDERVLALERVVMSSGRLGRTIELVTADLVAVSGATPAELTAQPAAAS